ncbi:uncharacterized protein K452DRAFT_300206 [Aplosporella prunicola CBS 121167]|uniref:F-box domain-containing protein n=1 Tax=Aplosporella prunicola CBS 121167 TaxID=1176127 RepID=A0A6A6B6N1_9PEZI|nr:uncharacterized protein K452DRAFT_300206 [Aplosporella prunicola CBS 121167]KAF2139670.1 hypothetical protein K452DRAFT_300206 [Aplosporella prunicola CBS 121167]
MVQRRRSTLSFRPKTSHAALESHDATAPTLPRPPKRTQSQVFGSLDSDADVGSWRSSHHATAEKEAKLSHDPQTHSRRASTLQNLELAIQSVKELVRSASSRSSMPPANTMPSQARRAETMSPSLPHELDLAESSASHAASSSSSQQVKQPGTLRRWASARRSKPKFRRPAVSGPANDRWNPVPPPGLAFPPYINYEGGQAARDSASQFNSALNGTGVYLSRSLSKMSNAGISETDSVIGDDQGPLLSPQPIRKDFVSILPRELTEHVFSFLDAASLASCERVSKPWHATASSRHVWREIFNRRFEQRIHVDPPPLQMGGVGAGLITPGQDWKSMYRIRKTIERRWLSSHPAAIYFNGHTDSVYCCQFDEEKIITGSRDRTIRVWDLKTYRCLKVIGGPQARPVANTPAPLETKRQYTQSNIPSLNGTPEGNAIYHEPAYYHSASILCLQFDDEIMVTGSSDSTCIVWNVKTWEPLWHLHAHQAGVLDVCFDNRYIISCSKDNSICIWSRHTGELLKQLRGHTGPVNAIQMRGNLLVSASGDGTAMIWDLEKRLFVRELRSGDRGLAAVEFSDDAKYVLAGGNDQTVYKFDISTGNVVKKFTGHNGLVRSLFLDTPNKRVVSGSYDQSIRIYHYDTAEEISVYDNWTTSWILSAKSDYRRVVATSQDGRALLLDFGYGIEGVEILAGTPIARSR